MRCEAFGSDGIASARADQPDVIYLDLEFENMTEAEAIAQLREVPGTERTRILARSALGPSPSIHEIAEAIRKTASAG